jgi:hypothetical protein
VNKKNAPRISPDFYNRQGEGGERGWWKAVIKIDVSNRNSFRILKFDQSFIEDVGLASLFGTKAYEGPSEASRGGGREGDLGGTPSNAQFTPLPSLPVSESQAKPCIVVYRQEGRQTKADES